MKRREVAAARGPSNRGPPSPQQTPQAQHPAQRPDRDPEADNSPQAIPGLSRPSISPWPSRLCGEVEETERQIAELLGPLETEEGLAQ